MKLLFDENLPPQLVRQLAKSFPDSKHVRDLLGRSASDARIWESAKQEGIALVTKDADFTSFSTLYGHPPKLILVALGNCTIEDLIELFESERDRLLQFQTDSRSAIVIP